MTTIDEATGLPALPEGMFWRIKENGIEMRRGKEVVHYRLYGRLEGWGELTGGDPVTPENVVERCQEVLAAYNEKVKREALYGDYPPKKFEGA